jgi:antitoxin (DNA-binding transcriptional repressor) of toxin-antitoxin stability system
MRVLAMRDAKTGLSATLDEAQHDRVLITRDGRPSAIVIGVEGREFEDVLLMSNPKFWEMIEASRRNPRVYSMTDLRDHFAPKDSTKGVPRRRPKQRRSDSVTPPKKAKRPTSAQRRSARQRARG